MNQQILGTCSLCGGPVGIPPVELWIKGFIPRSQCLNWMCRAEGDYGPVLPMTPRRTGESSDACTRPVEAKPPGPKPAPQNVLINDATQRVEPKP